MLGLRTAPVPDHLALRAWGRPTVGLVRWVLTDPQVTRDHEVGHAV
jgi:hypothetical protein